MANDGLQRLVLALQARPAAERQRWGVRAIEAAPMPRYQRQF